MAQFVVWVCDKCNEEKRVKVRYGTRKHRRDLYNLPDGWAIIRIIIPGERDDDEPDVEDEEDDNITVTDDLIFCMACKLNLTDKPKLKQRVVEPRRGRGIPLPEDP